MKTTLFLFLLAPALLARDITTLDGKTYLDCKVSQVLPDSICVLFSGGGARVKFTNLPEPLRVEFGYDAERAAAFAQTEADRDQKMRAALAAQRQQAQSQARTVGGANQYPGSGSSSFGGNSGAQYVGVNLVGVNAGGLNQNANQFGNGYRGRTGTQYVGVNMASSGGIYGLTYGPVRSRPSLPPVIP